MMTFAAIPTCVICGHKAGLVSSCSDEHCEVEETTIGTVRAKWHRHCAGGCHCTDAGCMPERQT